MTKVKKTKSKAKKSPVRPLSRKELRKQKVLEKKEHKRLFFSSKTDGKKLIAEAKHENKNYDGKAKKNNKQKRKIVINPEDIPIEQLLSGQVDSDDDESIDSNFSDEEVDALMSQALTTDKKPKEMVQVTLKKSKQQQPARPDAEEIHRKELRRQRDLENASMKRRIKQLKVENEDEDKMIVKLEKKLGLNKTKNKNRLVRKMFNDGLDFALELCLDDEEEREKEVLRDKRKEELKKQVSKEPSWSDEEQDEEKFNAIFGSGDESQNPVSRDMDSEENEIDEESDFDEQEEYEDFQEGRKEADIKRVETKKCQSELKEDIYGRKRDKDGNIIKEDENNSSKIYIPPHQRALLPTDDKQSEVLERLRRQCKGLLNRLSEANLHKISTGIEDLYMKNSRFNMNETLNKLLQEALISKVIANERMVQEHMVLLAYLHAHIGSEIGAHFLQMFIEKFDGLLRNLSQLQQEDKSLNNVVLVLSYMYVFKIFEHKLLLEIVDRLTNQLDEKTIECLLLIFQSVGFKLRKDDPLAFKQMMLSVQTKIAASPLELKDNLRLKFMVDILNAVKNNNTNKIPKFDPLLHENLRKKLKAMLRNDKYVITLNINMNDLLRADTVGKWWVVGSAWTGNINEMSAAQKVHMTDENNCKTQKFSEHFIWKNRRHKAEASTISSNITPSS